VVNILISEGRRRAVYTPYHSQDCASHIPPLVPIVMLPHRNFSNVTTRVTGGSAGGGRPLSLLMSTQPIPQITEPPPPASIRPRQYTPDSDVGRSTPTSSPHLGSGRNYDYSHKTADYAYRFDTMPSPRSDSGPPYYESADISGGIHANVWPTYNKVSQEFDEMRLAKWNTDLDVLLVFVSLIVGGGH
jgi:hypothetical protein